jgi:hypothetical protein
MANTIDFNVNTNAVTVLNQTAAAADNTAQGFSSAKAELRALNNQLLQMDQSSEEFKKASKRAAELKDNISDLSAEISANAGNAFEGLSNNIGLFGSRLMDLDLAGAGQALKNMGTNVSRIDFKTLQKEVGGLVNGFASLAKAIISNPILLLAGAVALVVANFDDLIKLFPSVESGLSGINEQERESLALSKAKADASQKAYESIDKQVNSLKLQGKSEREILNIKLKALETAIADRKTQLEITEKQAIVQVQTAKRNREILEGIIRFLTAPLQLLLTAVDKIAEYVGVDSKLAEGFTDLAAGLLIDPQELETELNKTIQENKDAVATMENDYAGLKLQIKQMDSDASKERKKNAEDAKKEAEKDAEDAKKRAKDLADFESAARQERLNDQERIDEEIYQSSLTAQEKEIDAVRNKYFELITLAEYYGQDATLLKEQQAKAEAEINKKYKDEEIEAEKKLADERKRLDKEKKEADDEKIAAEQEAFNTRLSIASSGLAALGALNDAFTKKGQQQSEKQFKIQKALNLASAVIDTYGGINRALNDKTMPSTTARIIQASIVGAMGLANVLKISKTEYGNATAPSGTNMSTGGGGEGGTAAPSPANFAFLANQPNQQQPPLQAYVVGTQVSSNLEAQQLIQNQSRLGG